VPHIDPDHPVHSAAQQRAYYEKKGIVFLDDSWSMWHIRVWANAREHNGFSTTINADVVFRYAEKFGMDDIDTLERIQMIERGAKQ